MRTGAQRTLTATDAVEPIKVEVQAGIGFARVLQQPVPAQRRRPVIQPDSERNLPSPLEDRSRSPRRALGGGLMVDPSGLRWHRGRAHNTSLRQVRPTRPSGLLASARTVQGHLQAGAPLARVVRLRGRSDEQKIPLPPDFSGVGRCLQA